MRLFTAIELPDEARSHLVRLLDYWRTCLDDVLVVRLGIEPVHISWVRDENLHVTLKFIGEIADTELSVVRQALSRIDLSKQAELHVSAAVCLPSRGPIHLITAGLDGDVQELEALHREVEDQCAGLGVGRERRKFFPHITLARPRSPLLDMARDLMRDTSSQYMPGPWFKVRGFALVLSQLKPSGPDYTIIERFPSDETTRQKT